MKRSLKVLTVSTLSVTTVAPSLSAENLEVAASKYEAASDFKADQFQTCGLLFTASLRKEENLYYVVQGSLNSHYLPKRLPGLIIKISAARSLDDKIETISLKEGSVRIGSADTSQFVQEQGADNSVILMLPEGPKTDEWFQVLLESSKGFWVTFADDKDNITFKMPAMTTTDQATWQDFLDCQNNAVEKLKDKN